jgi:hypothetical protein
LPDTGGAGFGDEQLRATLAQFAGAGDDANQPTEVRFLRGVAKLVKRRLRKQDASDSKPAVFFLRPAAPASADDSEFHPMLDNGETPIGGKAWFVSPLVVAGTCVDLAWTSDAQVFEFAKGDLALGDVPAVIFDPRPDPVQVRFYPLGLEQAEACDVREVAFGVVELDAILAVIDRVHEKQLVTPDAHSEAGKLWEKKTQNWVSAKAELTIQMYLETALNAALPTCTIRSEQPQVSGRLDIEVEEPDDSDPSRVTRHALLELKVLKNYGSTGESTSDQETSTWIDEGVDQAYAYREERGTTASALCCFDMRKGFTGPSAFDAVRSKAQSLQVTLRVWHLFATAKEYRAHVAKMAAGSA